ncbi:MAG: DUF2169 domain-containing protein, partial [Pseudomonadota bacterium]|nr:DUF2169 domain-containing protein [Pseudomonadota bacterium]
KDFNELFYHCAPQDQQIAGYLTGGEPVILYNLSPSGEMRFQLPVVSLGFKTFFGTQAEAHHALLHTVIIEPDIPRVMLVWHTHLPCHNREHKLDHTVIFLKK